MAEPLLDDLRMHIRGEEVAGVAVAKLMQSYLRNNSESFGQVGVNATGVRTYERLKELSRDRSGHAMGKQARSSAWLDAELLFRFRNSFMHSKPGWDDQTDVHNSKLMKELKTRVPVTPSYQSNFMFPYGFLTYGCAKWAVESARAFSAEFCALIDVNDRFAGSRTGSFFHNFRYAVQPAARCPIVKLGWEKQRRDSQ